MKRIIALFSSFLLLATTLVSAVPAHAVGPNLITNSSVELSTNNLPNSWGKDKWGTNTTTFTYASSGHTGTKAVTVNVSGYKTGDAKWYPTPVAVSASTNYTFSDWYQSTTKTSIDAVITTTANKTTYKHLGDLAASATWKQATYAFTTPANAKQITFYHYIEANGQLTTDDYEFGLTNGTTPTPTPTPTPVPTPTAPAVQITSPTANTTVSGTTQAVNATATDAGSITQVQFKLDGNNLGSADTTAPYSANWDTTSSLNGNHVLTAVATNNSNLSTTSTSVTVNVQNVAPTPPPAPTPVPAGPNLIPNPSLETAASATAPATWISSNWGTNTATFSYLGTGHTGSHSVKTQITSYTNGAANWYYPDVPVTAGKTYKYENWYQSNVDTEVDAQVTMADGTVQYFWLGTVLANTNWTKYTGTFTVPAGAKSMAIYQILAKTGYIVSDDYSLAEYTPTPFNQGLVSVTFDDGWANQYTNAFPVIKQYSIPSTFYLISGEVNDAPDYMSATQIKNLFAAGNEIGSHSVTHSDMTTLSQAQITNEFSQSQTTLQNLIGVPVKNFAYPYGAYNAATVAAGQQYYQSQRTVSAGYNTKDSFNITGLKIYEVDSNISQAQVQGWIQGAIAQKSWLILVYHEVATSPVDPSDALYTTQPSDFAAEMAYLKNSGVKTVTVQQALNEILPQL